MENDQIALLAQKAMDSAKSAHSRIDDVSGELKDLHDLTAAVASVDERIRNLRDDFGEIKMDLKQIADKPEKRFDAIINAAISVVVSGIVGAVLAIILK